MTFHLLRDYNTLTGTPKPDLPYIKNQEWTVTEHFPSEPPKNTTCTLNEHALVERRNIDILTRCVKYPPLPGQLGCRILHLRIVDTIRVGDGKTSQLVLVDVLSDRKCVIRAVAKFYDPLYFDHEEIDMDSFRFVDVEYTSESAAYRRLSTREESKIPAFYGTYTLDLIIPPASSRSVRLILLGYIDGAPMNTLRPSKLNRPHRKAIMKQIVSAESRFYENDVIHSDVHPRDIIIQGLGARDLSKLQIVFVDFGNAEIGRSCDPEVCEKENCFFPRDIYQSYLAMG